MEEKLELLEYVLHDESISFAAKGVFSFLLLHNTTYDDDPIFSVLRMHSLESTKEINEALDELLKRHYIISKGPEEIINPPKALIEYSVNTEGIFKSINLMEDYLKDLKFE